MTDKDLKAIREKLEAKAGYKRDIALAKAQKEVDTINGVQVRLVTTALVAVLT